MPSKLCRHIWRKKYVSRSTALHRNFDYPFTYDISSTIHAILEISFTSEPKAYDSELIIDIQRVTALVMLVVLINAHGIII